MTPDACWVHLTETETSSMAKGRRDEEKRKGEEEAGVEWETSKLLNLCRIKEGDQ